MRFGSLPIAQAKGAIAAHSVRYGGGILKKGTIITADHIAALQRAGIASLVAARMDAGDVHEDAAATALAEAIAASDAALQPGAAFTGRVNLRATRAGLLRAGREAVDRLNLVDGAITLATLADRAPVATGQLVATVKIIPFAVSGDALNKAVAVIRSASDMLAIAPYLPLRVAHISTVLPDTRASVLHKTRQVLKQRLAPAHAELLAEEQVSHDVEELAAAIARAARRPCDMIVIFAASAISDTRDIVPAAVRHAGGVVRHLGMPVDPGNLLMLGALDTIPVIGAPGCARSPALNGFDWVLQRLLAGLDVAADDIMGLGVGGLLKEIATRPQPRSRRAAAAGAASKIAAIVLAAGQSRRMGRVNKLLTTIDAVPLVRICVQACLDSEVDEIIVVTGHQADAVGGALHGLDVTRVYNHAYADGLAHSIACGIDALAQRTDIGATFVVLADMPGVEPAIMDAMIAAFRRAGSDTIVVPVHNGKRGNPVLWPRRFFAELGALRGDVGARHLIEACGDHVCEVAVSSDAVHRDIDTLQALFAHQVKAR